MKPRLRHLPALLLAAVLLAWFVLLRPAVLGGSASYLWVTGVSKLPTLETGDFVVTQKQDAYAVGDVLAYRVPAGEPGAGTIVIHRLIGGAPDTGLVMQGDNKPAPDEWHPTQADIVGKLWVTIPGAGKYLQLLRTPTVFAPLVAGIVVFFSLVGGGGSNDKRRHQEQAPVARS
jgi:signal peptidase